MDPFNFAGMPEWVKLAAMYWTLFSTAVVGGCSWLKKVLWPPQEINRRWYTLSYRLIDRIGMAGRKEWNGSGGGAAKSR